MIDTHFLLYLLFLEVIKWLAAPDLRWTTPKNTAHHVSSWAEFLYPKSVNLGKIYRAFYDTVGSGQILNLKSTYEVPKPPKKLKLDPAQILFTSPSIF